MLSSKSELTHGGGRAHGSTTKAYGVLAELYKGVLCIHGGAGKGSVLRGKRGSG